MGGERLIFKCSGAGRKHKNKRINNQDVIMSKSNKRYVVLALADGVSSCKESKKGAYIACTEIVKLLLKKASYFLDYDRDKVAKLVMEHISYELSNYAFQKNMNVTELSSTLAGVLYDKKAKKMLYFNLGDSMIISAHKGVCTIVSKPFDSINGCPVTTTKNAYKVIDVDVIENYDLESLLILSDGAWHVILKGENSDCLFGNCIVNNEYDVLSNFLREKDCEDDYSFIAYNTENQCREVVA